ncbi:MAG: hypothetical protein WAL75_08550 [Terracidiphilus sp.]
MRRGFSILLMLVLGLGPLSSLIDGSEDVNLPACCRRHGAHHCAMDAQMAAMAQGAQSGRTPMVSAPVTCPSYPGSVAMLSTPAQALATASRTSEAPHRFEYVRIASHTAPLSKPAQTHAGRGPPASSLS